MQVKIARARSQETVAKKQVRQQSLPAAHQPAPRGMVASVLNLQRSHGNHFVQRMLNQAAIQRKCACGDSCAKCQSASAVQHKQATPDVQRQLAGRPGRSVFETNYAFDTFNLTEGHLSDPDIIARLNALTRAQLIEYRNRVADPAVQSYINGLLATRPSIPCTAAEVARTNREAETARTASVPWIGQARTALERLHSRWINEKADLLAGRRTLEGEIVCAFNSNFNITQRDPNYGVRQIQVMSRLRQLDSRMNRAVTYTCQPDDDPICVGNNQDTVAYVRGGQPPIYFCRQFRENPDTISQQSTVIHEYAHLLPGVHDTGGYALNGFGAQVMTCSTGVKFTAASDVLTNTADALTGFVMHIGQTGAVADIRVR
jgi:hypothetical protein